VIHKSNIYNGYVAIKDKKTLLLLWKGDEIYMQQSQAFLHAHVMFTLD